MRRTILLIGVLLMVGFDGPEVHGADWKYLGGSKVAKGEDAIIFYDAEGVERTPNGNVRAWTKAFTDKAAFNRTEKKKKTVEGAARKLVVGYVPPYCLVDPKNCPSYDTAIDMIGYEETANDTYLQPRMRALYETDCEKKMIRTLSIILYKKNGGVDSESNPGEWNHISPETNAETLHKVLCNDLR
jgi:hypothetical protein